MGPNEKVNAIVEVVRDHAGDLVQVREIVAKASDGQRYPLPLGWCMLDVKVKGDWSLEAWLRALGLLLEP